MPVPVPARKRAFLPSKSRKQKTKKSFRGKEEECVHCLLLGNMLNNERASNNRVLERFYGTFMNRATMLNDERPES